MADEPRTLTYEEIAAALNPIDGRPPHTEVRISVTMPGDVVLWECQSTNIPSTETRLVGLTERFINVMRAAQGLPVVALVVQDTI